MNIKWKTADHQTRLRLIAALILLFGLVSSVLVYLTAENNSDGALSYETAGGEVYQTKPEDSKMYRHDLELYGGKANLLANDLRLWFVGLWHGKQLAFTVASITIIMAFIFFYVAHHSPDNLNHGKDENDIIDEKT